MLRAYDEPPEAEEFTTAHEYHLIVLVTGGPCDIEARYPGGWQPTHCEASRIGMTAAGEAAAIRWRGVTPHSDLQLHLPKATLRRVMQSPSAETPPSSDCLARSRAPIR